MKAREARRKLQGTQLELLPPLAAGELWYARLNVLGIPHLVHGPTRRACTRAAAWAAEATRRRVRMDARQG